MTYNPEQRAAILKGLQVHKIHIRKHALAHIPRNIARHFAHPWAPVSRFLGFFGLFPDPLLSFWLDHPAGHVVITAEKAGYVPGEVQEQHHSWAGVAYIPLASLVGQGEHPLIYLAHLFDHLLGCDGIADGLWLSEGGGYLPAWQAVGERIHRQFALGYAESETARQDPRRYFAEGIVAYWSDRRGLRVQDPGLETILRTTLLNPAFWKQVYRSSQTSSFPK